MCVSLRKRRTAYAAALVRALWGTLSSVASHSLFLIEPLWLAPTYPSYCKRYFSLEVV